MTISTTYSFDPDLQGLVRVACRRAGVLGLDEEPDGYTVAAGGEFLNMLLKGWQAAARLLRQVENVTKTLISGTATVTVDADTIDIEFPAYLTPTSGTQSYIVERMTLDEYNEISNKAETGTPTLALVQRKAATSLTLWPIPDATVNAITYTRVFLIKDIAAGQTADVHQRHLDALCWGLSRDFAEHYRESDAKIMRLEQRYMDAKRDVFRDNSERGPVRFSLS